ncbi:hypothetical protein BJ508DRAFT_228344 [Ascobolus immersus RN42]|uniref:intramembrane prenyl-peptidase Rce1 n=1 Tax=Ascobolus immersus RN42 TaxID=1160509 RepID=A0A3N4I0C7_ASCIM|nr:hypothetical protein BJ508DRAFT_228344 [Ascobolus immersus RN42]
MASPLTLLTQDPPLLAPSQATLLSLAYTLTYVLILYTHPLSRPNATTNTDDPTIISVRIRLAIISTLLCTSTSSAILYSLLPPQHRSWDTVLSLLGLSFPDAERWAGIATTVRLVATLFAGPILEYFVLCGGWRDWKDDLRYIFLTWGGWKKFLVAPLTEEVVFRAAIVPLHIAAGRGRTWIVFVDPLFFGLAHCHHLYEYLLHHPFEPVWKGCLISAFQFTYTTIFGWFAAYAFIKSGSVWAVFLAHAICNWLGLPRMVGMVEGSKWKTIIYYIVLVAGAWGFYRGLMEWERQT